MNKQTLAVVIPCYNAAATLDRALKSVLNQSRLPDEIIVVDDCSDNSDEIESIALLYDKVKLIRNKENCGPASSRNVGLRATECDIVTFIDADDESHPYRFEQQLEYISHNTVVTCNAVNPENAKETSCIESIQTTEYSCPIRNMFFPSITGAALMAEVALLKSFGGYDSELRANEDYDLYLRLLKADVKVIQIKNPLYFYHDVKDSLSKNSFLIAKTMLISVKKFLSDKKNRMNLVYVWCVWFVILSKVYVYLEIQGVERAKINELNDPKYFPISSAFFWSTSFLLWVGFYRFLASFITKFTKK